MCIVVACFNYRRTSTTSALAPKGIILESIITIIGSQRSPRNSNVCPSKRAPKRAPKRALKRPLKI